MFSGEVPERPAGPGPRGDGPRDRALHHRGGGMIEFGGAFLALKVIPQAATAGARAAGALQVGSRRTCGRNSLYPRVVPRGATQSAPPSCELRRRRVRKLSIRYAWPQRSEPERNCRQFRVGNRRSPDVPASSPANQKRISGTHAGAARRGRVAFRTPSRGDLLLMPAAGASSMTVSIIHGTGGWTPRPSAGTPNRPFSLTAFRLSS